MSAMRLRSRIAAILRGRTEAESVTRVIAAIIVFGVAALELAYFDDGPWLRIVSIINILLVIVAVLAPRSAAVAVFLFVALTVVLKGSVPDSYLSAAPLMTAGMLLLRRHWGWYAVLVIVAAGNDIMTATSGIEGAFRVYLITNLITPWFLATAIGVGLALLQRRIDAEVLEREARARAAAHERIRARLAFALDTHDTVGHSLATQAAILRLLRRSPGLSDHSALVIGDLQQQNAETHDRLRGLLRQINESASSEVST